MKKLYLNNKYFLLPWLILTLVLAAILIRYDKTGLHIFINSHNTTFLDFFFKYWTWLGDGIVVTIIAVFLLFIKYRYAIISGISLILSGLCVQILKNFVFADSYRPALYFKLNYKGCYILHTIAGAEPGNYYSFPSGHTAAAFALFLSLSLMVKSNFLKFLFLIAAILVGYSRIYLSWHFLDDVLFGSLLGVVLSLITYLTINPLLGEKMNGSLLKRKI